MVDGFSVSIGNEANLHIETRAREGDGWSDDGQWRLNFF